MVHTVLTVLLLFQTATTPTGVLQALQTAARQSDRSALEYHLSASRWQSELKYRSGLDVQTMEREVHLALLGAQQALRTLERNGRVIVVGMVSATIVGKATAKLVAPRFVREQNRLRYEYDVAKGTFWVTDAAKARSAISRMDAALFEQVFLLDSRQTVPRATLEHFVTAATLRSLLPRAEEAAFYAALAPAPRATANERPRAPERDEAAAIANLRAIHQVQTVHYDTFKNYATVKKLIEAGLLSTRFERNPGGYAFTITTAPGTYEAEARPTSSTQGRYGFVIQTDGTIRYSRTPTLAPPGQAGQPAR
jgi:hypothetical protein